MCFVQGACANCSACTVFIARLSALELRGYHHESLYLVKDICRVYPNARFEQERCIYGRMPAIYTVNEYL